MPSRTRVVYVSQEMFDEINHEKDIITRVLCKTENSGQEFYKRMVNFRARFGLEFYEKIEVILPEKKDEYD